MTDHSHHQHHAGCSHGADTKTATDPVCGMKVDPHYIYPPGAYCNYPHGVYLPRPWNAKTNPNC